MVSYKFINLITIENFPVLILVVMEDGLVRRACSKWRSSNLVLILVVMEDGLVLIYSWYVSWLAWSLNPCCNGRWSRTNTNELILSLKQLS